MRPPSIKRPEHLCLPQCLTKKHFNEFELGWMAFDPAATGTILASQIPALLGRVPAPLGETDPAEAEARAAAVLKHCAADTEREAAVAAAGAAGTDDEAEAAGEEIGETSVVLAVGLETAEGALTRTIQFTEVPVVPAAPCLPTAVCDLRPPLCRRRWLHHCHRRCHRRCRYLHCRRLRRLHRFLRRCCHPPPNIPSKAAESGVERCRAVESGAAD